MRIFYLILFIIFFFITRGPIMDHLELRKIRKQAKEKRQQELMKSIPKDGVEVYKKLVIDSVKIISKDSL